MADDSADPSMEEILASIRKIISDDAPQPAAAAVVESTSGAGEDVLELTQMMQDDGSIVDLKQAEPPPPPAPSVAAPPQPAPRPVPPPPTMLAGEKLMSDSAEQTASASLASLADSFEVERRSTMGGTATLLGHGGRTLEEMVVELMRPMLKDWLDQNLPATVDRLVQKEIERIARRS